MNQEAIDSLRAQIDALTAENELLRDALEESVKALSAGPDGKRLYPESRLKALALIAALTKEATNG